MIQSPFLFFFFFTIFFIYTHSHCFSNYIHKRFFHQIRSHSPFSYQDELLMCLGAGDKCAKSDSTLPVDKRMPSARRPHAYLWCILMEFSVLTKKCNFELELFFPRQHFKTRRTSGLNVDTGLLLDILSWWRQKDLTVAVFECFLHFAVSCSAGWYLQLSPTHSCIFKCSCFSWICFQLVIWGNIKWGEMSLLKDETCNRSSTWFNSEQWRSVYPNYITNYYLFLWAFCDSFCFDMLTETTVFSRTLSV